MTTTSSTSTTSRARRWARELADVAGTVALIVAAERAARRR